MLALAVLLIVTLIVANFGVVWGANAAFLNADKKESSSGDRVLAVGDEIVGARSARQYLPLFAAAAMSAARLAEVTSLTVTFNTGPPPDMFELVAPAIIVGVERTYTVVGATKVSATEMYFETSSPGAIQRIHLKDGRAHVVATLSGVEQWRRPVCEANAECAALVVDTAAEVAELVATATASLVAAGVRALGEANVECEVCAAAAAAYAGCADADKASEAPPPVDAAPACFAHYSGELGFAEAFTRNSLPFTCASITDSSLGVTAADACELLHTLCPATCAPHGHRLADDEHAELYDVTEGSSEWEQQERAHALGLRHRGLDKCAAGR
jgi:hypothetical protein